VWRGSPPDTANPGDPNRYSDTGEGGAWSSRRSRQAARSQSDYVLPSGTDQAAPAPPNWSDLPSRSARESTAPAVREYGAYYGNPSASEYQQPGVREYPPRQREQAARAPAYPAPWGAQYAPPGWSAYAAPPAAGYYGYSTQQPPAYPTWGVRPGYGTGGY
jgi:hypothetical protein